MGKTAVNIFDFFKETASKKKDYDPSASYYSGIHVQTDSVDAQGRKYAVQKGADGIYYAIDRSTGEKTGMQSTTKQGIKNLIGYATGTSSAKSGLARVIEQGSELLATKEGFLYEMSGGEMVFNNDQFRFLYEFSKTPINKMLGGLVHNDNSSIDNSITINGISIDAKSQEGEALKDILTRILGNR